MAKSFQDLTIMNDFMFGVVMRQEQFCKPLLEYILGIKIRKIVYISEQETIEVPFRMQKASEWTYILRMTRTLYTTEMQTNIDHALGKRTRFYQSLIDIRALEKGHDYKHLKKSYIIFICNYDPYGKSRYIYTFRNRCDEDRDILIEDDTVKIIINTKGTVGKISEELKAVIQYMDSGVVSSEYTKALDDEVASVKADEKVRLQYMLLIEAYARERTLGEYKRVVMQIRNGMSELSVENMARLFRVSIEKCEETVALIKEHPDWDDETIAEEIDWEE